MYELDKAPVYAPKTPAQAVQSHQTPSNGTAFAAARIAAESAAPRGTAVARVYELMQDTADQVVVRKRTRLE